VAAQHQRHVSIAFADREPRDARVAVGRAHVVGRCEAVDAEDLRAARRELVQRCRTGCAEADDDDVE
jgi:hypothetical protein